MNRRDIVIGIGILLLLAGVVFFRQKGQEENLVVPQTLSVEDQIEKSFNIQIPEDVDKAELKDTTGAGSSAIATRKFENGKFEFSVLADLPDPAQGQFYQGWLIKGEEGSDDFSSVSAGKMRIAKGGWMIEYNSATDYSDHGKVVVSLEKTLDSNIEEKVLEGSF